jgi:hypothetical protein
VQNEKGDTQPFDAADHEPPYYPRPSLDTLVFRKKRRSDSEDQKVGIRDGDKFERIYNNIARHRGGAALFTIREQKYLLHHRSHCRYRRRPQSAPRDLASMLDTLLGA